MSTLVFGNPRTGKIHRPIVPDYPYEPPWTACGCSTIWPDGTNMMTPITLDNTPQPDLWDLCRSCWPHGGEG